MRYVDDVVSRNRDTTGTTTLDERLYGIQDGNWNVSALADSSGGVLERFAYTAFGAVVVLTSTFEPQSQSVSYSWDLRYAGYRWDDEVNLYQVRNRNFSALTGWLQRDPLSTRLPNLYVYSSASPIRTTDPFGNQDEDDPLGCKPRQIPVPEACTGHNIHTVVEVCVRPVRTAPTFGHVFIKILCGDTWYAFGAGPLEPCGYCKEKCGERQQLRLGYGDFSELTATTGSPEFPEEGEPEATCTTFVLIGSPHDTFGCVTKMGLALRDCCIPYGQPIPLREPCNSNCAAWWINSCCFGRVPAQLPLPHLPTPGWKTGMPDCVKRSCTNANAE